MAYALGSLLLPLATDVGVWATSQYKLKCFDDEGLFKSTDFGGVGGDAIAGSAIALRVILALVVLLIPNGLENNAASVPVVLSILVGLVLNVLGIACALQHGSLRSEGDRGLRHSKPFKKSIKKEIFNTIDEIVAGVEGRTMTNETALARLSAVSSTVASMYAGRLSTAKSIDQDEVAVIQTNLTSKLNEIQTVFESDFKDDQISQGQTSKLFKRTLKDIYKEYIKALDAIDKIAVSGRMVKVNKGLSDTYLKLYVGNIILHIIAMAILTKVFSESNNFALGNLGVTQSILFFLLILASISQMVMLNTQVKFTSHRDNKIMNGVAAAKILIIALLILKL